jgi:hypothetical protein
MRYVWRMWVSINGFKPDVHAFVSGETLQEAAADAIKSIDVEYGERCADGRYHSGADCGVEIVGLWRVTALMPYQESPPSPVEPSLSECST